LIIFLSKRMFYSLLFLTALLSQWQGSDAASVTTRAIAGDRARMAALNNLVVIGDPAYSSSTGSISFSFYNYQAFGSTLDTGLIANAFVKSLQTGNPTTATVTGAASGDLAGNTFKGLGHAVAIADMSTVFVSQTSTAEQTGRVVVYNGNITSFSQKQVLIPYDGKHRQDSSAAFGESISATPTNLAIGCQNCNSSAPVFSGAVYVYKANKEGRWSESQVLTADGVMFLGEKVALHEHVLVAAGDDKNTFAQASNHNFGNDANTVVVFEEKGPKFEQRQVLMPKSGGNREGITGLTVFDETIAITTKGSDTTLFTQRDKVYIYYPMNKRYGMEPKGKPSPQQWTNTQILTDSTVGNFRYVSPDTSISGNELQYLTTVDLATDKIGIAKSSRSCLSCQFSTPVVTAAAADATVTKAALVADASAFYTYSTVTDTLITDPDLSTNVDNCMNIQLLDQYNDGWGTASLVVTSPTGREDKYTLQCTTQNPMLFKYCPTHYVPGKYHIHVENGEETPFGWEIYYYVSMGSTWYAGDRHTHMDFLWDTKYENFVYDNAKGVLPQVETCEICDPNKPAGKHRSLSNLRSLHHKGKTSSPTISQAPTLVTGGSTSVEWNKFVTTAAQWFAGAPGTSTRFMISDDKGKKLLRSGTTCSAAITTCWIDLPDGDYMVRVGTGTTTATHPWKFCGVDANINENTEFKFSIVDQQCYVGAFAEVANTCSNNYVSDYYLKVDLILGGGAAMLSSSDKSTLTVALTETMISVVGSVAVSAKVTSQGLTSNGLAVSAVLQFESTPDSTALNNFVQDTSSASSLLKYELIGTQSLAAKFLEGGVSAVSIVSANAVHVDDLSQVDESSFQTVIDHAWTTASTQESNNFNVYAKYVAEGAYALVAVAAVLAVSLFVRRASSTSTVVVDIESEMKPTTVTTSLEQLESASDSSSSDQDSESDIVADKRVNLSVAPKRSIDITQMKKMIDNEDEVFKSFLNKSRK
jgi:hypothetical protein